MKRSFILLLAIINIVLILSSCAEANRTDKSISSHTEITLSTVFEKPDSNETTSEADNLTDKPSETHEIIPNAIESISAKYPGKTVLTISCNCSFDHSEGVSMANEYLSSIGKEYVIYIQPIKAEFVKSEYCDDSENIVIGHIDYNSEIEKIADKIDIILSQNYMESVEKGMLLPLDEYIEGSKLQSFVPEKLWNGVRIDGKIYGIDCYSQIGAQRGYFIDCELADKYSLDLEKPLSEQLDLLKVIDEKENCSPVVTYNQFFAASLYLDSVPVTDGVCLDSNGEIKSILDDDGYISFLKEVFLLNKEGLIKDISTDGFMGRFLAFEASTRFPPENLVPLDYAKSYNYLSGEPDFARVYPVFIESPRLIKSINAAGISAKSKHSDYAYDFLETAFTDPTLNNIMCYGDYTNILLEDGRITEITINKLVLSHFSNGLITLPTLKESVNKREIFERTVEAVEVNPDIGFTFHAGDLTKERDMVQAKVYEMCNMLLKNEFASFEEYISAFKTALSEAGVGRLIESAAEQYNEWRGEQ